PPPLQRRRSRRPRRRSKTSLSLSSPAQAAVKKLARQARCSSLRPLPLRERAARSCHEREWGGGWRWGNPSPMRILVRPLCPLTQGERAREATPPRGTISYRPVRRFLHRGGGGDLVITRIVTGWGRSRGPRLLGARVRGHACADRIPCWC